MRLVCFILEYLELLLHLEYLPLHLGVLGVALRCLELRALLFHSVDFPLGRLILPFLLRLFPWLPDGSLFAIRALCEGPDCFAHLWIELGEHFTDALHASHHHLHGIFRRVLLNPLGSCRARLNFLERLRHLHWIKYAVSEH